MSCSRYDRYVLSNVGGVLKRQMSCSFVAWSPGSSLLARDLRPGSNNKGAGKGKGKGKGKNGGKSNGKGNGKHNAAWSSASSDMRNSCRGS